MLLSLEKQSMEGAKMETGVISSGESIAVSVGDMKITGGIAFFSFTSILKPNDTSELWETMEVGLGGNKSFDSQSFWLSTWLDLFVVWDPLKHFKTLCWSWTFLALYYGAKSNILDSTQNTFSKSYPVDSFLSQGAKEEN